MSDGESGSASPKPRRTLKVLLIGLAIVALAGSAGAAGWLLATRHEAAVRAHEAAVRAEAADTAEQRCQKFVARRLFEQGVTRSRDPSELGFTDSPLAGTDPRGVLVGANSGGHLIAAVVGDVRIINADGEQIVYRFECRLSAYSARDRNWGALSGITLEPKP